MGVQLTGSTVHVDFLPGTVIDAAEIPSVRDPYGRSGSKDIQGRRESEPMPVQPSENPKFEVVSSQLLLSSQHSSGFGNIRSLHL